MYIILNNIYYIAYCFSVILSHVLPYTILAIYIK